MTRALRCFAIAGAVAITATGCARPASDPYFPIGQYREWRAVEPSYRLFPGDTIAVEVLTAPELSRGDLVIAPDGRAAVPLAGDVVLAGRTLGEAESMLADALADELRDPQLNVRATGFGSQQVFVGGEVQQAGVYPLPGQITALEAVLLAGGFQDTAGAKDVVVVRRGPDGHAMMRVINIADAMKGRQPLDAEPLQRFDVVYVPKSTIAEVNLFFQQYVRDALPIEFGLFYDLNSS